MLAALGRGGYSTVEEREAEVLASLILKRASDAQPDARVQDPEFASLLRRAKTFYGGEGGE